MAIPDPDSFTRTEQQYVREASRAVLTVARPLWDEAVGKLTGFAEVALFTPRLERALDLQVFEIETVDGLPRRHWRGDLLDDRSFAAPLYRAWDTLDKKVAMLQSEWMASYLRVPEDPALLELASEPVFLPELEREMFESLCAALPPMPVPTTLHVRELRCMKRSLG